MIDTEDHARFDAALEQCCRRVQAGEPLERCLPDYPAEYREELARLAPMAGEVAELRRDPSPEFQACLERRLMELLGEKHLARRPAGPLARVGRLFTLSPVARLAALVVTLAFLVGSGVGVVQAEDSLPDSPLYQVKTAREWLQLALARSPEVKVDVHAAQIATRGRELERAVRVGKPRVVVVALALRLARSTDQAVELALERKAAGNPQPAARAVATLQAMQRQLERLAAQASPEARPVLRHLYNFLGREEQRLRAATPETAPVRWQDSRDRPEGKL